MDTENASATPSMSEEEINALPVHKYKVTGPQRLVGGLILIVYLVAKCFPLLVVLNRTLHPKAWLHISEHSTSSLHLLS